MFLLNFAEVILVVLLDVGEVILVALLGSVSDVGGFARFGE